MKYFNIKSFLWLWIFIVCTVIWYFFEGYKVISIYIFVSLIIVLNILYYRLIKNYIQVFFNWMKKKKDYINNNFSIEYFKNQYWLLLTSSISSLVYFLVSISLLVNCKVISTNIPLDTIYIIAFAVGIVIFVILSIFTVPFPKKFNKTPFSSFLGLLIATILFMILISGVVIIGGAKDSYFSPILVTICGLTVVFPKTKKLKVIFAISTVILFVLLILYKMDITIIENDYYILAYVCSTILAISATILVTLKYHINKIVYAEYDSEDVTDIMRNLFMKNKLNEFEITTENICTNEKDNGNKKKLVIFLGDDNCKKIIKFENEILELPLQS